MRRIQLLLITLTSLVMFMVHPVLAAEHFWSEVRDGIFAHDTGIVGTHRERGIDFSSELVSRPFESLAFIGSPGLVTGFAINTAGQTHQAYVGLTARRDIADDILGADTGLFIEGTVGLTIHSGKKDVVGTRLESKWKSHGSAILFRVGGDLGVRLNRKWSLALSFNHISNADLASPNQGSNNLGLRLGRRF